MIKNTKKTTALFLLGISGLFVLSCDSEPDGLGSQFFQESAAEGTKSAYDIIAYNISNSDTIKADGRISSSVRKDTIVLGAFSENQFGGQKASFVSQLRMSSYAPAIGDNAKIDSVVMVLKPKYHAVADSTKTVTLDEGFTYGGDNTPAKKVVKTYPIYKYGKAKQNLTINVHEVNDFLGSVNDTYYSNKNVSTGTLIGSGTFGGTISSVDITKDSDNSSLLSIPASIRVKLDNDFFKTKILDKKGSSELSNLSNFIRYFKGIKISVAENDGYLMKLGVTGGEIIMYYSHDTTADGTTTKQNSKLTFDLGNSNASFSKIEYNRAGSAMASVGYNTTSGDSKLYLQGMGGNNIGVKVSDNIINELKQKFKNDKVGILSAKMRFYTDGTWDTKYPKPSSFTVMQDKKNSKGTTLYEFLTELSSYTYNTNFRLVKGYNLSQNQAYYDITITETLKKIIETDNHQNYDFMIKLGEYLTQTTSSGARTYYGANVDNRLYSPERVVLIGSDGSDKKAQLLVTYIKK